MVKSALRIQDIFFDNVEELTNISFSNAQIEALKEVEKVLEPVQVVVEMLGSESASLLTAETSFIQLYK